LLLIPHDVREDEPKREDADGEAEDELDLLLRAHLCVRRGFLFYDSPETLSVLRRPCTSLASGGANRDFHALSDLLFHHHALAYRERRRRLAHRLVGVVVPREGDRGAEHALGVEQGPGRALQRAAE